MRKIHIGDEIWGYGVGKGGVTIKPPHSTKKTQVDMSTFTGMSWDAIERLNWKGPGVQVTPQQIKDYIVGHLKPF